jgi:2-dehydro-3-deoxygluconokinase
MTSPGPNRLDVLAFGEAMVEFNQSREDPARYVQDFGGDTSNFCVAAARNGARAGYISAVGDDSFGRMLRGLWRREGIDDALVLTDPGAPTGLYFVSHDERGHHFEYRRAGSAASRYRPEHVPHDEITRAKALHLSGISLAIGGGPWEAGLTAMAHARSRGVRVSFDTNLRLNLWPLDQARAVLTEALALTDICLPSWDDVTAILGLSERDAIVDALLRLGVSIVALKLGREGCYLATPESRTLVPPHAVPAVDATGAGDCFGGAFVARLVAGDPPLEAARYANVAAALSTRGYGAVAPIPRADEVRAARNGAG